MFGLRCMRRCSDGMIVDKKRNKQFMELQFLDRTEIYMKWIHEGDEHIIFYTQTLCVMYRTSNSEDIFKQTCQTFDGSSFSDVSISCFFVSFIIVVIGFKTVSQSKKAIWRCPVGLQEIAMGIFQNNNLLQPYTHAFWQYYPCKYTFH